MTDQTQPDYAPRSPRRSLRAHRAAMRACALIVAQYLGAAAVAYGVASFTMHQASSDPVSAYSMPAELADDGATIDDVGRWLREGCSTDWDCLMLQSWADANCGPNGCAFGGDL